MGEAIRVLHVDDDPQFIDLTAAFLDRDGGQFVVESATDAEEGQQLLSETEFDCIVSDYDMPGLNGIEFLERVREEYPRLPFILFTGKGSEEVASDAIAAGVTGYLQKGSGSESFELLANRIENTVSQYRAQKRAAETEQRLLELSEATNEVLWIFSADWEDLHFVNSAYEAVWGRSTAQLREDPTDFLKGIHPDDRDRVQEAMQRLSNGRSVDVEYRVNEETGYSRWVWVQGVPIREDGEVVRIAGFSRDVTDQKRQENRLREEQEFIEQTLDALNDTFYVFDTAGTLIRWNDQLRAITGYSDDELAEMGPLDFFPPEEHDEVSRAIDEVYETGESIVEAHYLTADDERIPFEFTGVELTDRDGETLGFAGIGRNVTDRKERERELERTNERLEEFASIVSHDLRNPLNVAELRLELARDQRDSDNLAVVDRSLERMDTMIEDLLTLARSGDDVGERTPVDLSTVARTCWDRIDAAEASLDVSAAPQIEANRSTVRQLIENLLQNAVEHSSTSPDSGTRRDVPKSDALASQSDSQRESDDAVEHGGPAISVTIGRCSDGFYVADDGPGIPSEDRESVFETGYTTGEDGLGLGLSIVQQIATAHGWDVDVVESEAGGARFEVTGVEVVETSAE